MSDVEGTEDELTTDADTTDATEYTDALTEEEGPAEAEQNEEAALAYAESLAGESKTSTKAPSKASTPVKSKRRRKKRTWMEKCMDKRWTCDNMPSWRIFMNTFLEDQEQFEKKDIFKQRRPANLRPFPRIQSEEDMATPHGCLPLSAFQLRKQMALPNKVDRTKLIRIWKNMREDLPPGQTYSSKSDTAIPADLPKDNALKKSHRFWPCTSRDLLQELKERQFQRRKKRLHLFPCDPDKTDREVFEDSETDFSRRKELGHVRIPQPCLRITKDFLVDRAAGETGGLVDGDYIIFELPSKAKGSRIYADVCLSGLKGMHLQELTVLRARKKTWKFCFYQAVVALLAKTQIRYKFAWNENVDYCFNHAWMLYTHIGTINLKEKQRLDDVVVYNYKYSIEIELIREVNDVPIVTDIPSDYEEKNLKRKKIMERAELMFMKLELGSEKITDQQTAAIHKGVRRIEELIDDLPIRYRNCIFRTTRFCIAFWKDNFFWYLYNPYRCDKFGYWDNEGVACIMKFCSKQSLKRHLMILLLRAYVYTIPKSDMQKEKEEAAKQAEAQASAESEAPQSADAEAPQAADAEAAQPADAEAAQPADAETPPPADAETPPPADAETPPPADAETPQPADAEAPQTTEAEPEAQTAETEASQPTESPEEAAEPVEEPEEDPMHEEFYTVQIYHVTHHCCQIHNIKLLQRMAPNPPKRYIPSKTIDDCPFDPLDMRDPCTIEQEESDIKDAIEKPIWLKLYKVKWGKSLAIPQKKKSKDSTGAGKMRWHQYVVEESNKLFSIWGELHITDSMFERENRGMQTYACYVVCAGMTRIMAPEYWSSKILDVIVMCGDRYFTHSKMEAQFKATKNEYSHVNSWNRYLMSHFTIGETMFEAKVHPAICGVLYSKSNRYLWQSLEQMFLKYPFGILTCESSCLGIFKFCGAYYICDVNSFGPPLFQYGEGSVYMLRATYFYKFITSLIVTIGSPECSQFGLNPIEILKVLDLGSSALPIGKAELLETGKRITKVECPYDEAKRKQMRKWKHRRQETEKLIDKLCCKGQ